MLLCNEAAEDFGVVDYTLAYARKNGMEIKNIAQVFEDFHIDSEEIYFSPLAKAYHI